MQAYLHADCYSVSFVFRTVGKDKKNPHKNEQNAALYIRMYSYCHGSDSCASIAFNIHQMGYFTLLGIFILELFLTRENMKINEEKKHFKEAFHCHWIKACTVLTLFQNFNTIYSKLK